MLDLPNDKLFQRTHRASFPGTQTHIYFLREEVSWGMNTQAQEREKQNTAKPLPLTAQSSQNSGSSLGSVSTLTPMSANYQQSGQG